MTGADGALPVVWRAELVALALLLPSGLAAVPGSALASGIDTGSVTVYFLPPVAIALGALLRDEPIAAVSILGTALVASGAHLVSRREAPSRSQALRRFTCAGPNGRR